MARSSRLSVCLATAELLEDPLRQIDQPPAHHAMDRRDRAVLDHQHNSLALGIIEPRGLAWRFAVKQAVRTACVEPQYPIPDDLKPDPADLRCLRALRTVINRRKSQKPPGLRPILRLPRQATKLHRLEIHAQRYRNRHGEPPAFATLNQSSADLGILEESRFQGFGITQLATLIFRIEKRDGRPRRRWRFGLPGPRWCCS